MVGSHGSYICNPDSKSILLGCLTTNLPLLPRRNYMKVYPHRQNMRNNHQLKGKFSDFAQFLLDWLGEYKRPPSV